MGKTVSSCIKVKKYKFASGKTRGEVVFFICASIFLGIIASTYVFAYLWGVLAGMKSHDEIILRPFTLPENWSNIRNYIDVFSMLEVRGVKFFGMIENTLMLVLVGPLLAIGGSSILAYIVAKYRFPGRNLLISINVVVISLPIIGGTAATYRLFSRLGMINSPLLLLNFIGNFGANFLYMLSCFNNTSSAYMEAARIDGAGHYSIMFKIMLPLAMPMMSALWILSLISVWNDVHMPLLFWNRRPTLATGIYLFNLEMTYRARMDILMAAVIISSIPPLILFAIFHNKILSNVTFGGIKG